MDALLEKYKPLGRMEAGELLLAPADALRLAEEATIQGVPILGVGLWQLRGNNVMEDPRGMDLSEICAAPDGAAQSALAARTLLEKLPQEVALVSLLFDEESL